MDLMATVKNRTTTKLARRFFDHRLLFRYILVTLLFAMVYLAADIISRGDSGPKPVHIAAATCSYPDKSFCATLTLVQGLVRSEDFSDILQNQVATTVHCPASGVQACQGIKSNLNIQLFEVHEDGQSTLMTRNDYISFFRSYFTQNGPFRFASSKTMGNTSQMEYANTGGTKQYTLTFVESGGQWQLAYPAVGSL